jgi:hypothetical protein
MLAFRGRLSLRKRTLADEEISTEVILNVLFQVMRMARRQDMRANAK